VNGLARFILPDALEGGTKRTVESFSAVARIRSLLRCLFTSYAYTGCSGGISPLIIALSPPCPSNYSHRSLRFGGLRRSAHIIRFSRGSSLEHYRPGRENDFGEINRWPQGKSLDNANIGIPCTPRRPAILHFSSPRQPRQRVICSIIEHLAYTSFDWSFGCPPPSLFLPSSLSPPRSPPLSLCLSSVC